MVVALLHQPLSLAAGAGSTPGVAGVGTSGAATYSVPLSVPSGVGGLQPNLALVYDSQSGRGLGSVGWSLQGLSAVKRCPQSLRQDGTRRGIGLNAQDRFCLDGQRLVLESNALAYGSANATYRTEIDSFSRITSLGTAGSGPQSFKVESKDGLTMELGASASSRLIPAPAASGGTQPTTVAMWSVSAITDRFGNSINYSYLTDAAKGSQVIDEITYNGGKAWVKFLYTDDTNPRIAYIAGTRVTHDKILSEVQTFVKDQDGVQRSVKKYALGYEYSDVKGGAAEYALPRLVSITECGADGVCLNPIKFDWNAWKQTDRSFSASAVVGGNGVMTGAGWGDEQLRYRRFADLNDDGIPDIVGFADDGVWGLLSSTTSPGTTAIYEATALRRLADFGWNQGWQDNYIASSYPRHVVDMNRDGYSDIVGIRNLDRGGVWVSYWQPASKTYSIASRIPGGDFFTSPWGAQCGSGLDQNDLGAPKHLVDMNGDGYPDMIGFSQSGVYVAYWDGASFSSPTLVSAPGEFRMHYDAWLGPSCEGQDIQPIFLEDMNGDGFPDIVGVHESGVYVSLWNPEARKFNAAGAPNVGIGAQWRRDTQYPIQMADMNGDGYPDIVRFGPSGVQVALWTGEKFLPPTDWTTEFVGTGWTDSLRNPRRLADVNGDGFPDVVGFTNDGVKVGLSNGNGKILPAGAVWTTEFKANTTDSTGNTWGNAARDTPRYVMDINGDGVPDIVGLGNVSIRWASPSAAPGTRITKVTDSLGATTEFTYTLAQKFGGSYQDDSPRATWPVRETHAPLYVVGSLVRDNGAGGVRTTRYRYAGRKVHAHEGSLGFAVVGARDETTGIETVTTYQQEHPHIGTVLSTEAHRSSSSAGSQPCSPPYLCYRGYSVTPGSVLSRTTITPEKELLAGAGEYSSNGRYFTYAKTVVEERWDLDGSQFPTKTSAFQYEEPRQVANAKQWGNLTKKTVTLSDGRSVVDERTYEPAVETTWSIGRLAKTTVTSSRPAVSVSVSAPTDAAPPTASAPPVVSPAVLNAILSLLLDD